MADVSDVPAEQLGRLAIVLLAAAVAAVLGWFAFVVGPGDLAELVGVLLVIALVLVAARIGGRIAASLLPDYNVAEVAVDGPITRDGGTPSPFAPGPVAASADEIVDQIELADDDDAVDALVVRLNTPGGEVVPSDDIREAVVDFQGPTVAYATDLCASGGYWIASGCDQLWAHEASLVGSIGVLGSRPNVAELADRLGVSYERFTAGAYKDAGIPLREIQDDERAYLQGIVDDYYERFVDRVAEGRDLDPAAVRNTEAKVYLGDEAAEIGLVDRIGDREDVEAWLESRIADEPSVREFTPDRGLAERLGMGARGVAYALGAGLASNLDVSDGFDFKF